MHYYIKDGDSYLKGFNNCTVWFTADPNQALAFDRQKEVAIVSGSLQRLASTSFKICSYAEVM